MNDPKVFCFDLDGVIFSLVPDLDYNKAQPLMRTVGLVNYLYHSGHYIKLYTARGSASGIGWKAVTERQLKDCGLMYHELHFGKPAADFYIDDKFIALEELFQSYQ